MKSIVSAAAGVAFALVSTLATAQAIERGGSADPRSGAEGRGGEWIDPAESPYLDVIETTSGSTWRGVLVEQIPGKSYKIVLAGGSVVVVQAAEVVKITKDRWHRGRCGLSRGARRRHLVTLVR
jgi:hypothetical protein